MSSDARDIIAKVIVDFDNEVWIDRQGFDDYLAAATDILDALTAAGWVLVPPGGETRQVFRCLNTDSGGAISVDSLDRVHALCATWHVFDPFGPDLPPCSHQVCTVTTWPDGSEHHSPWTPTEPTDGNPTPTTTGGAQT